MSSLPKTKYAKSGDISIAYQVVGDGPLDLVVVPGWISHLDLQWEMPGYPEWIERLTRFSRVILFDKRGIGLSDRDVGDSTLDERMDDLRAVLDAVGLTRAAVLGFSEGGALAMLFAATYPERVQALVLYATMARVRPAPDYPEGKGQVAVIQAVRDNVRDHWGEGATLEVGAPSFASIEFAREFVGRLERAAASPRAAAAHLQWAMELDVRPVARSLGVPTLVLHRVDDRTVRVECGRWLASNIPGAHYVEDPGDDHSPWYGDAAALVDDVQEFLTGSRGLVEVDRVLATVLFTDIIGSTERVASLGARAWRDLLDRHHAVVREEIRRHRGEEQDTAGDGFLATFDGPARAVRCASSVREAVRGLALDIRAGLHTGECERVDDKVAGIAVHTGARIMAEAGPSEVLVSSTVKDLVAGSGLAFRERGTRQLKGIPGEWRLFAVE
jgi:class 3 adenylate cyclase